MKDLPNKEVLLEEYRQLMESQRDNTRIAYSWINSIFLVLSSSLFFFGLTTDNLSKFVPAMIMGILLCLIWVGLTQVFARYTRQHFDRLRELSNKLGIAPIPPLKPFPYKWFSLSEARTFVILFVLLYIIVWIIRLVMGFIIQ